MTDILRKNDIKRSFNKAATSYNKVAFLQKEISNRLLERLQFFKIAPQTIVDLGAGPGISLQPLAQLYPSSNIIATDIAHNMMLQAKTNDNLCITLDAEFLPFKNNSIDLIFANCILQWCDNLPAVFAEIKRVLAKNGAFIFSTFGPDTLKELKQAWFKADETLHVNNFIDMHNIGDMLLKSAFADPVVDNEIITIEYQKVRTLCRDLKSLGANTLRQRQPGLVGKYKWKKMEQSYSHQGETYPATYEVIYGIGWHSKITTSQKSSIAITVE